jgi:hypothetical protein
MPIGRRKFLTGIGTFIGCAQGRADTVSNFCNSTSLFENKRRVNTRAEVSRKNDAHIIKNSFRNPYCWRLILIDQLGHIVTGDLTVAPIIKIAHNAEKKRLGGSLSESH